MIEQLAYAQKLLKVSADGTKRTAPEKEALAVLGVQMQMTEARIAEAMAEGSKRYLHAIQTNLSSCQTRASLLKTERSLLPTMT